VLSLFLEKIIMLLEVMRYPNIFTLFAKSVEQNQNRNIFYQRNNDEWQGISWESLYQDVLDFACALKALQFTEGKSVCIFAGNSPLWPTGDLGTIVAQGVSVGLYPTSSIEQCQYIIAHANAEFVLVDMPERLTKILSIKHDLPHLKKIIALNESLTEPSADVMSYKDFLQTGRDNRERFETIIKQQAANASGEDVAIMVYTSGTTGLPKGACLSHRYVINSAESVVETLALENTDTAFSYLPFCHVAERVAGFYTRICAGMSAYFIDDITKLYGYMLEVKPTVFGSLPRFFEKIHARIMADIEQASDEERQEFAEALRLGLEVSRLKQRGETVPAELQQKHEQTTHHVTLKVRQYTGNVRMMTSGGAPLPLEIGEFFDAAGIPILEAYGLTENICVAFNRPNRQKFGSVGVAMPGCEIKLAGDGEILVRSNMMFSGYYKEPEKTAEMFCDGWLLTGDLGELDEHGFLKITGRKKELIITSTGKNIAPLLLENLIKEHPLISHAMIYGDGKSYLVALITLNQIELEEFAHARNIRYATYAALTKHEEIIRLVQQIIAGVNNKVSSTECIKNFCILDRDLSPDADEVTPTMKVRRNVVTARYKKLLEALYA
jgi:long-chain acyl-CoA synthetase